MNTQWSEMNASMQKLLKKQVTYEQGIATLSELRNAMMEDMMQLRNKLDRAAYNAIPFMNKTGYHNKTIAYSLWHIFRIEDIVVHSLIAGDEQLFFKGDYQKRIQSPIITTGNELRKEELVTFSEQLDMDALYAYMVDVKNSTEEIIRHLTYQELKRKMTPADNAYLKSLHVVSEDDKACWLIDYWCSKDVRGLIIMPLSRHWIMHVNAAIRIMNKL